MATFTWVATTVGGANPWETMADWINSPGTDHPASFTVAPGNDYLISNNNGFTINQIGTGGPGSPDVANSITLSSLQAKLLMAEGGGLDVSTTLSLSSLLNMGTNIGGSVLSIGADHPALTDGWQAVEHTPDGAPWRWSAGDADLPVVSDGPCMLEITLSETTTYIDELAA